MTEFNYCSQLIIVVNLIINYFAIIFSEFVCDYISFSTSLTDKIEKKGVSTWLVKNITKVYSSINIQSFIFLFQKIFLT